MPNIEGYWRENYELIKHILWYWSTHYFQHWFWIDMIERSFYTSYTNSSIKKDSITIFCNYELREPVSDWVEKNWSRKQLYICNVNLPYRLEHPDNVPPRSALPYICWWRHRDKWSCVLPCDTSRLASQYETFGLCCWWGRIMCSRLGNCRWAGPRSSRDQLQI